ncbi:MAG: hypothetical protein RL196_463 [Actinomycetota bacterium]|jgi:hypothetical protein
MFELSEQQKISFAGVVLSRLEYESISAISKSEIELLIFKAFLEAGAFDLTTPPFEISQKTMMPLSKIENLIYKVHLAVRNPDEQFADLARNIHFVDADPATGVITLSVENKFFRELLISKLRALNVYTNGTFNKDLIFLSEANFDAVLSLISVKGAAELKSTKKAVARQFKTARFIEAIRPMIADLTALAFKTSLETLIHHYL